MTRYHELAAEYEKQYQEYFREQAGILAASLINGDPCPVCGSTHHPKKAELSLEAPTAEQVEQLKNDRNLAEEKREQERKKLLDLSGRLEQEKAVIREHDRQMFGADVPERSLAKICEKWKVWEEQARKQLEAGREKTEESRKRLEAYAEAYRKAVREESIRKGQLEENRKHEKIQRDLLEKEKKIRVRT